VNEATTLPAPATPARPSFEATFMELAHALARRSTCARLQVGCVIVSADWRVVFGVGYNGGAAGQENECASMEPGQCFPGNAIVSASGVLAASRRPYEGSLVRVITAEGEFSVTPNHPVLALRRGWGPTQLLAKGDHLLHPVRAERESARAPYDHDRVPIEQVFEATALLRLGVGESLVGHEFHGDCVVNERVDVVSAYDPLWSYGKSSVAEQLHEPVLAGADRALGLSSSAGALREPFRGRYGGNALGRSHRRVYASEYLGASPALDTRIEQTTVDHDLRHPERALDGRHGFASDVATNDLLSVYGQHRFSLVSAKILGLLAKDASFAQSVLDCGVRDSHGDRNINDFLAAQVAADEVLAVERYWFSGHVFNLETRSGWYSAGAADSIVHNCGHLHAEDNAIVNGFGSASRGVPKVVLCTNMPCPMCCKRIVNLRDVVRVVFANEYRAPEGAATLRRAGIGLFLFDRETERLLEIVAPRPIHGASEPSP